MKTALLLALHAMASTALVIERPAHFGRNISDDIPELLRGEIVSARPFDACGDAIENDVAGRIVLVVRGKCNFAYKALQAQKANASAIVVMDDKPKVHDEVWGVHMISDGNVSAIVIPSVFVAYQTGEALLAQLKQADSLPPLVTLNSTGQGVATFRQHSIFEGIVLYVLSTSVMFVLLSALCFVLSKIVAWYQQSARTRAARRLPMRQYHVKSDEDVCSICLETFDDGVWLKVLPCDHEFHQECIDPWLQHRNGNCPLCKREALDGDVCVDGIWTNHHAGLASWLPYILVSNENNYSVQMFLYGVIMMLPLLVAVALGYFTVDL
ncbi:hypothetical protein SPRG_04675 [Saprolegnia parasitica CBS 223.65]|uniref:RING-type domain-containing protein n=1 Tax=Saprolegnia parasitica (strain CBS 223.65) TaxID=695850 RepID=A0A067CJ75_SAPPC|nr:hypothetical protein SPRG_04675 [Saprolegnia parasitica CBS 223.65]KDO30774.1 hypothetical protein SPRG_04675 [Saprolegnia parasitica CBS 223.65]|eukprot:XP_012198472.1 hypothetical protein SPRG_04675 [Saprolegnia parasitica CBS 223.65]